MLLSLLLAIAGVMKYGGTFIGAVICQDGIVMASDSRTTFIGKDGAGFAYIDGMPKIFTGPGGAVAVSGMTNLEGELFNSFVRRNDYLLARPPNEVLFGFIVWLPFTNGENVGLLSAGYIEGKPMICVKSPVLPQNCSNAGLTGSKASASLEALKRLGRLPTTAEAAAALAKAIEEHARTDVTIGGPVSILKLTRDGQTVWLQNQPTDRGWTKVCDIIDAHRAGKAKIVPRETAAQMNRRLSSACPQ